MMKGCSLLMISQRFSVTHEEPSTASVLLPCLVCLSCLWFTFSVEERYESVHNIKWEKHVIILNNCLFPRPSQLFVQKRKGCVMQREKKFQEIFQKYVAHTEHQCSPPHTTNTYTQYYRKDLALNLSHISNIPYANRRIIPGLGIKIL